MGDDVVEVDPSSAVSGSGDEDMTVIEDLDREGLVEHFAIETEAKTLREWVEKTKARPNGFEARLGLAEEHRKRGNQWYEKEEYFKAVWFYLAALHALDYSKKDRILDEVDESTTTQRQWQEATAVVLSNMAAAFGAKDDNYNAIRAANLGLKFAEKLRIPGDRKEELRAKLHYRRGIAHSRSNSPAEALDDLNKAVNLDQGQDKAMLATLRRLKEKNKEAPTPFNTLKGKLSTESTTATIPKNTTTTTNNKKKKKKSPPSPQPLPPEKNLAERRAARRTLSARWSRFRRRAIQPYTQKLSTLVRDRRFRSLFGLFFTAIAAIFILKRQGSSDEIELLRITYTKYHIQKGIRYGIIAIAALRIFLQFSQHFYKSKQRQPPLALLRQQQKKQQLKKQ